MKTIIQKCLYTLKWTLIFIVAGSMLVYGIAKPVQFTAISPGANPDLSEGHIIMWNFYSYTQVYPIIIGAFEAIGGIALLFKRTRIFGCLLLSIILSNIILQDYLYEISALRSALFYQVLVFGILAFDYKRLQLVVRVLFRSDGKKRNFILLAIALILALFVKFFETSIL